MDVMSLPAPLAITGSARNRPISASLVYRQQDYHTNYTLGNYFNPVCVQFRKANRVFGAKTICFCFMSDQAGHLSLSPMTH